MAELDKQPSAPSQTDGMVECAIRLVKRMHAYQRQAFIAALKEMALTGRFRRPQVGHSLA